MRTLRNGNHDRQFCKSVFRILTLSYILISGKVALKRFHEQNNGCARAL